MSLTRTALPEISVVMPARDASRTLKESVASLQAQTFQTWELIIVDDGSSDGTGDMARELSGQDSRIRCFSQEHAGVSHARNRGLAQAAGEWVLFLDSDDTIAPNHLEVMLAAAREHAVDMVVCGYARSVGPEGEIFEGERTPISRDGCVELAASAHFPIHAAITRRELIVKAGGFDPSLEACEDWDLWLKVAGQGVTLATVPQSLAIYRNRAQSLSKSSQKMWHGANEVLIRQQREAYGPSMARYKPEARKIACRRTWFLLWSGAIAAAQGDASLEPSGTEGELAAPRPADRWHTQALVEGLSLGANLPVHQLLGRWAQMETGLLPLFQRVEERTGKSGLATLLAKDLAVELFHYCALEEPMIVGDVALVRFADLLRPSWVPPQVDAIYVQCQIHGELFRIPGIPVLSHTKAWDTIRIAAFELACLVKPWSRKRRFLRALLKGVAGLPPRGETPATEAVQTIYGVGPVPRGYESSPGPCPGEACCAAETSEAAVSEERLDKEDVWESLFESEDPWDYGNVYEQTKYQQTLDLLPPVTFESALEVACAEGHFTVKLCERVKRLHAVDISQTAIRRAQERCREKGNVEFATLDFMTQPIEGTYDLIVCSEVLYYVESREQLDAVIAKFAAALNPGGCLLTAHARLLADDSTQTAFDWGHAFGAEGIVKAMRQNGELTLAATFSTDLYRIDLLKKAPAAGGETKLVTGMYGTPLPVHVAARVVWHGARRTRLEACGEAATRKLPVLMYHRIADEGAAKLAKYRVSPAQFEKQLRYLRRRGYYSLEPDAINPDWPQQEFPGRPLIITFDDGYADFESTAWPILRRNGFTAHVFVSTGQVGGTSSWEEDEDEADRQTLMTWEHIRKLSAQGVTFGSHLVSHTAATSLSSGALLREAYRSRTTLGHALGRPVFSIAPPYGALGFREQRIFQAAGYRTIYAAGADAVARVGQVVLQRIRVDERLDLTAFGRSMDLEDPELDACERDAAGIDSAP
ncbi:polysaccharide deacetylase [Roseimicrobium gellanilyticum]|uniref:Polysaccharide deacetylase n=1 Tax=Roseimicrobium gellanilyticum TaxID=748857 RepID=A0A366HDQ3_9BACT|nr:trifunctional glycosyltransferase/class I SAM-dependent methyltransferase/polysaccharide deacetylase [Roseimicrobium gellanilyticum]RBP40583.1 polysaccharide deacetylase [Roseimicrobium gellanilyticum]